MVLFRHSTPCVNEGVLQTPLLVLGSSSDRLIYFSHALGPDSDSGGFLDQGRWDTGSEWILSWNAPSELFLMWHPLCL